MQGNCTTPVPLNKTPVGFYVVKLFVFTPAPNTKDNQYLLKKNLDLPNFSKFWHISYSNYKEAFKKIKKWGPRKSCITV